MAAPRPNQMSRPVQELSAFIPPICRLGSLRAGRVPFALQVISGFITPVKGDG